MLRRRGAPPSTIDDGLQTAAERALMRSGGFDTLQGWTNWTIKVAWHEVQGQWKRDARLSEPVDAPGGPDPAAVVEHQIALAASVRALDALSATDRQAILECLDERVVREPLLAREKMRRYRARRRLAAIVSSWGDDQPC